AAFPRKDPMRPQALLLAACALAASLVLLPAPLRAGGAPPPTKGQQKCITSFGAASAQVARARAADNGAGLPALGKGTLDKMNAVSLRSCLARDSKGKIAKKEAKLAAVAAKACGAANAPSFGLGKFGTAGAAHFAETQTTDIVLDLLSQNLFA